jgi:hypothetical protein
LSARSATTKRYAVYLGPFSTTQDAPELHLRSDQASPEDLAGQVIGLLETRGML